MLVQRALLKLRGGIKDAATAVTLSPDQQVAYCGSTDGTIHQWNLTDANQAIVEPVKTFVGHAAPVTELCVSPSGLLLCSVSDDKTLRIWNIADGSIVHAIEHPKAVASVSSVSRFHAGRDRLCGWHPAFVGRDGGAVAGIVCRSYGGDSCAVRALPE